MGNENGMTDRDKPAGSRQPATHKAHGRPDGAIETMRLLEMFEYLKQRGLFSETEYGEAPSLPLKEVADHFSYSLHDTFDMVSLLSCCRQNDYLYVPVYCDKDHEDEDCRIYGGRFESLTHPLRLSSAECTALIRALGLAGIPQDGDLCRKLIAATATGGSATAISDGAATTGDDATGADSTATAAGSIATAADSRIPAAADTGRMGVGEEHTLSSLLFAIADRKVTTFLYPKRDGSGMELRTVEPMQVQTDRGRWYLHAWCHTREGIRTFLIERMHDVTVTDEVFEQRDEEVSGLLEIISGKLPDARISFDGSFRIDRRDWPGIRIEEELADGTRIASIPYVEGSQWLPTRIVACLGAARALEPPRLVQAVSDLASRCLEESRKRSL